MIYSQTTPVPNFLFDKCLASLTESELKVMLVVIRQTFGWRDRKTGRRKERDRISASQFRTKSGLSKRIVTKAIQSLSDKDLLLVTDFKGNPLAFACDRKGRSYLFYSPKIPAHLATPSNAPVAPEPVHKVYHNKTNLQKEAGQSAGRGFSGHIGQLVNTATD